MRPCDGPAGLRIEQSRRCRAPVGLPQRERI